MSVSYNIYRMPWKLLAELTKKITKEGLVEQKTISHKAYQLKFYFSDKLKGNEVWWWEVFSDFLTKKVKNHIIYFILVC